MQAENASDDSDDQDAVARAMKKKKSMGLLAE